MADSDVSWPVSALLVRSKGGQNAALETPLPLVYDELRRMTYRYRRRLRKF